MFCATAKKKKRFLLVVKFFLFFLNLSTNTKQKITAQPKYLQMLSKKTDNYCI